MPTRHPLDMISLTLDRDGWGERIAVLACSCGNAAWNVPFGEPVRGAIHVAELHVREVHERTAPLGSLR